MLGPISGAIALIAGLWVIYDVLFVNKKMSVISKGIWITFAILFSVITAVIYHIHEKKEL